MPLRALTSLPSSAAPTLASWRVLGRRFAALALVSAIRRSRSFSMAVLGGRAGKSLSVCIRGPEGKSGLGVRRKWCKAGTARKQGGLMLCRMRQ